MIDLRSLREWLAEVLTAAAARLRPPVRDVPLAICPCTHGRWKHYGGNGRCVETDCICRRYAGRWPVDHLHVTTRPCPIDGQTGYHWAVMVDGTLQLARRISDMPGEE